MEDGKEYDSAVSPRRAATNQSGLKPYCEFGFFSAGWPHRTKAKCPKQFTNRRYPLFVE